jgi:hypothetical protein
VLAYVFWHRPNPDVDRDEYERALGRFHDSLENPSAAFRVDELPFGDRVYALVRPGRGPCPHPRFPFVVDTTASSEGGRPCSTHC